MAGEDVDVLEEGGGLRSGADPILLQPLVEGGQPPAVQNTRLASLDVFRGLAIAVPIPLFLNPNLI